MTAPVLTYEQRVRAADVKQQAYRAAYARDYRSKNSVVYLTQTPAK